MAEEKKVSAESVHIDDFLQGLKEENETLKTMFRHFHANVQGIEKATKAEFEKLLERFKNLPISELK